MSFVRAAPRKPDVQRTITDKLVPERHGATAAMDDAGLEAADSHGSLRSITIRLIFRSVDGYGLRSGLLSWTRLRHYGLMGAQERRRDAVAVVVVHGIGEHLSGTTVHEWAIPLLKGLDCLSRGRGGDGATAVIRVQGCPAPRMEHGVGAGRQGE